MRFSACLFLTLVLWGVAAWGEGPTEQMLQLSLGGERLEGMPLAWDSKQVVLLGRDGQLWEFSPGDAKNFRKTSNRFRPYRTSELRGMLLGDLGRDYEVTGTAHYLVAHPRGMRNQWARRFEELYRSFVHYFSVRGFDLEEPRFPLLGIAYRNREEFQRHAARQGLGDSRGVLGYYSPKSNRILLYDVGAGSTDPEAWEVTAATIIHEATHQTAFNTGVHNRHTATPTWVAEGLATMFEARGVYRSSTFSRPSDRINRGRFEDFVENVLPRHSSHHLRDLIASDRSFGHRPSAAYATAWALTFYLTETQPDRYEAYLARSVDHPPFQPYTPAQRVADFTAVFGDDWAMLDAQLGRFFRRVK